MIPPARAGTQRRTRARTESSHPPNLLVGGSGSTPHARDRKSRIANHLPCALAAIGRGTPGPSSHAATRTCSRRVPVPGGALSHRKESLSHRKERLPCSTGSCASCARLDAGCTQQLYPIARYTQQPYRSLPRPPHTPPDGCARNDESPVPALHAVGGKWVQNRVASGYRTGAPRRWCVDLTHASRRHAPAARPGAPHRAPDERFRWRV